MRRSQGSPPVATAWEPGEVSDRETRSLSALVPFLFGLGDSVPHRLQKKVCRSVCSVGPPLPFSLLPFLFWGRFGSPTKIDYSKMLVPVFYPLWRA